MAGKLKYISKSIKFGSKTFTLYSIDGLTWSSKRDELTEIQQRQESQRVTLDGIVPSLGDAQAKANAEKGAAAAPAVTPVDPKAAAAAKAQVPAKTKQKIRYKPRVAEVVPFPPGVKKGWVPSEVPVVAKPSARSRALAKAALAKKSIESKPVKKLPPPPPAPKTKVAKAKKPVVVKKARAVKPAKRKFSKRAA